MDETILKKIVKHIGIKFPVATLSKELDYSSGIVSEYLNGKKEVSDSFREVFEKHYDVKFEDFEENEIKNPGELPPKEEISGYYYPDVNASAGLETAFENSEMIKIPVSIPNFGKDIEFINVYGDSMYPKFCSGEIIGIKEVEPQYINPGYAYVIVFKDGQVFLKYIKKGSDAEHWLLASENPKYEPMEYHLSLIKKVFIIKGVITKTTM